MTNWDNMVWATQALLATGPAQHADSAAAMEEYLGKWRKGQVVRPSGRHLIHAIFGAFGSHGGRAGVTRCCHHGAVGSSCICVLGLLAHVVSECRQHVWPW